MKEFSYGPLRFIHAGLSFRISRLIKATWAEGSADIKIP